MNHLVQFLETMQSEAEAFFCRGTRKVKDDLLLSRVVGYCQGSGLRFWELLTLTITITTNIFTTQTQP